MSDDLITLLKYMKSKYKTPYITILWVSVILIGWCNLTWIKKEYPNWQQNQKNLHVSLESLIKCDVSNRDERNSCYYKTFSEELPLCDSIKNNNSQAINIEDIAKNCTIKNMTWFSKGWLWWACFSKYKLHKDKIISYDDCASTTFARDLHKDKEFICKIPHSWRESKTIYTFASIFTGNNEINSNMYNGIYKGLASWILDYTEYEYSFIWVHCWDSYLCKEMYDTLSRSSWDNFFMKWYKGSWGENTEWYYNINNLVYDPWKGEMDEKDLPKSSPRLFWMIQNNKMIVHKMIDIKYTAPYTPKDEKDFFEWRYNTYNLKTCEIDL